MLGELLSNPDALLKAFVAFVVIFLAFIVFRIVILKRLTQLADKSENTVDDLIVDIFESFRYPFYIFLSFYIAVQVFIDLGETVSKSLTYLLIIWLLFRLGTAITSVINYSAEYFLKSQMENNPGVRMAMPVVTGIVKTIIWAIILILVLSNFGVDVTALVAGLGIGGIAFAFAFQKILADLFSAFVLFFDKPFVVGDYVVTQNFSGTIEKIGLKTTHIRALSGEQIIVANQELTNNEVRNKKRIERRRVSHNINISHQTSRKKIEKTVESIKNIVKKDKDAEIDRVFLIDISNTGYTIEIVYYVNDPDFDKMLEVQQRVLLDIIETLSKEKVDIDGIRGLLKKR